MLSVEEYIARRKREDRLNEWDADRRLDNMRACVNYIFEFFGDYLNVTEAEERTVLQSEKLDRYSKELHEYDSDVRDWLVSIYADHGKRVNLTIANALKPHEFFLLCHTDAEFRSLSYDCYSQLIRKNAFLKEQTEMLFRFIKNYHQAQSLRSRQWGQPFISDEINEWVEDTWAKHHVDLVGFSRSWVSRFGEDDGQWPVTHRLKSRYEFRKYDYNIKQRSNLFNLDSLYRRMPKTPFTRGRKQEFEILMMHYWLHDYEGDDDGYWEDYCKRVFLVSSQE